MEDGEDGESVWVGALQALKDPKVYMLILLQFSLLTGMAYVSKRNTGYFTPILTRIDLLFPLYCEHPWLRQDHDSPPHRASLCPRLLHLSRQLATLRKDKRARLPHRPPSFHLHARKHPLYHSYQHSWSLCFHVFDDYWRLLRLQRHDFMGFINYTSTKSKQVLRYFMLKSVLTSP